MPSRRNPEPVPTDQATLIVIRGNSGSGKSTVARAVRERLGRGCALVEQDYLDVSFDETVRRHATRPQATEFTPEQMQGWYEQFDVLGVDGEQVIPESSTLDRTVELIVRTARPQVAASEPVG